MLLSSVVTDICIRAGIDATSIDVSAFTTADDVIGYQIPRQMPARTALETLMAMYNFDAAEEDWKLVFKKRGSTSIATIAANELRAHRYGDAHTSRAVESRTQDLEIPTHFTLTYESKVRDYELASQQAVRIDKVNYSQKESQVGIVLSDAYAKQQAEILLKLLWTNRHRYAFATTNKYIKLAPSDVITVNGKLMRVVEMTDRNGLVEFICESEEGGAYLSDAESDDLTFQAPNLTESGVIPNFYAMDIPAISEDYGNYGLTFAVFSTSTSYGGAVIQRSLDGVTYTDVAVFSTTPAVIGNTTAALSSGIGQTIDYTDSLVVDCSTSKGTLATIGSSLLWEGGNLAAIGTPANGFEIVQFLSATTPTTVANVYTITGFLRGLYGTENYKGTHTTDDKFILLTDTSGDKHGGVDFVSGVANGTEYFFRSRNPAAVYSEPVAYTVGQKTLEPYAPQIAFGSRNSSNDVEVGWYRGDRYEFIQSDFQDSSDIDQNEVSLNYSIDVVSPTSVVVRTVETTASTWTYTAAMQTSDSYPQTHPITFDVYQLSTVISTRGQRLRVSI